MSESVLRKFVHGLVFGAGFALAFVVVAWLAMGLTFRMHGPGGASIAVPHSHEDLEALYSLPIDEQIKKYSVIIRVQFERAEDGRMKGIVKEFLKKDPNTAFSYKLGDEYPEVSYYPRPDRTDIEGNIVFFVGSPAEMRRSVSYQGDRITGLGDMPMDLLRAKCKG